MRPQSEIPVIFINLDNRKDRLEFIIYQLNNYKFLNLNRYSAHFTPENGHLGCAKSHLGAIEFAIANKFEKVIILEDDFTFDKEISFVHNNINKINNIKNWDVILLTHCWGKEKKTDCDFLNKVIQARTSSAYIVGLHYYHKLKELFFNCVNNMNENYTSVIGFEPMALDQQWIKLQELDNWFVFNPHLGKQNDKLWSSIQKTTNYSIDPGVSSD